jgi:hypothetical protein
MFAEAFRAVAVLLTLYEVDKDGWHHAAIIGHTKASKLFPFTTAEAACFRSGTSLLSLSFLAQMT